MGHEGAKTIEPSAWSLDIKVDCKMSEKKLVNRLLERLQARETAGRC